MSKPKFLLITDNTAYAFIGPRYLGPYRLAYELENKGVETYVLDRFYHFPNFFDFLESFLTEDFVGIGLSTTFLTPPEAVLKYDRYTTRDNRSKQYYQHGIISAENSDRKLWFEQIKKIMSKKSPRAKLFVGGAKAQFFYHALYQDIQEVDYVVMGVVDQVFPQVIKDLIEGREPVHKMIGNKRVIDTAQHYKQEKVCPKHSWKNHWCIQKNEVLPIEIGRGCAFNCKFCNYDKKENTRKSLSDLKAEFIENYEMHGTQFYHFVDDCFNDSRMKVEEVCNLILSLPFKIEWASYMRFDVALKFPETMDLIVDSGGRGFHWGVESLTQEVARKAGKGASSEAIKEFIQNFAKKNYKKCYSTGSFIAGLPGETEKTWNDQIDWLINTENFDFVHIGPLGIAPYKHEFDGSVIDYADYSRNPQKYGFLEMDVKSGYWKHETADLSTSQEWAKIAFERWKEKFRDRTGLTSDIWVYPHLRSLGYTPEESFDMFFNSDRMVQEKLLKKGQESSRDRLKKYFLDFNQLLPREC